MDLNPAVKKQGGFIMLVLSRKTQEAVRVGGADGAPCLLKVTVLEIKRGCVKLGFEAAAEVPVHRWEIWEHLQGGGLAGQASEEFDKSVA